MKRLESKQDYYLELKHHLKQLRFNLWNQSQQTPLKPNLQELSVSWNNVRLWLQ